MNYAKWTFWLVFAFFGYVVAQELIAMKEMKKLSTPCGCKD